MRKGYVPVEPFRDWIKRVSNYYDNETELSKTTGVAWAKLVAIRDNKPYKDGDSGKLKMIDKVSITLVDRAITKDGRYHLVEFYPEVYDG